MFRKTANAALLTLVWASLFTATGCTHWGPKNFTLGGWGSVPIPVSPFFQDELEDQAWMKERYETVPILGPLTQGGPTVALDPPSQDEIMRALEEARPVEGGIPLLWESQRNNVRMVVEPIADYVDPPRVYPMIGPAQLHHAHYKCTLYFEDVTRVGWPIPYTTTNEDAQEVIYIDHNHLHLVGNIDAGVGSEY
jgi:hypothetical protein